MEESGNKQEKVVRGPDAGEQALHRTVLKHMVVRGLTQAVCRECGASGETPETVGHAADCPAARLLELVNEQAAKILSPVENCIQVILLRRALRAGWADQLPELLEKVELTYQSAELEYPGSEDDRERSLVFLRHWSGNPALFQEQPARGLQAGNPSWRSWAIYTCILHRLRGAGLLTEEAFQDYSRILQRQHNKKDR